MKKGDELQGKKIGGGGVLFANPQKIGDAMATTENIIFRISLDPRVMSLEEMCCG